MLARGRDVLLLHAVSPSGTLAQSSLLNQGLSAAACWRTTDGSHETVGPASDLLTWLRSVVINSLPFVEVGSAHDRSGGRGSDAAAR